MSNRPTDKKQKMLMELEKLRAHSKIEKEQVEISGDIDALIIPSQEGIQILSIKDSNYVYRNIIEEMNQGAVTIATKGLILYANKRFSEMLKMPLEKVMGSTIYNWFDVEAQTRLKKIIEKDIEERSYPQELFLNVSDGVKMPVFVSVSKLHVKEIPSSLCLMITDLTEIKNKEKLLDSAIQARQVLLSLIEDERQANFKNLLAAKVFEKIAEGIIFVNSKYEITLVNKAFTLISGYTEDEILGQPVSILYPAFEKESFYETLKKSIDLSGYGEAEIRCQRKDRRKILIKLSISRLTISSNIETVYIIIIQDITINRHHEKKLEWLAHHDLLTKLPNRTLFHEKFDMAVHLARRNHTKLAIMLLDIDLFKRVNDTFGHPLGDKLLIEVGKRLQSAVDKGAIVSHLEGDEFMILLIEEDIHKITHVVRKIINKIKKVFIIEGNNLYITVSMGVSIYPDDGEDFEALYKATDMTMFKVKQERRDGFQFTNKATHYSITRMLKLENAIFTALSNQEFYLLYQPQISLQDGHIIGAEALIRWESSEFGLISPTEFITLAEQTGQIKYIGEWVLRTAVSQLKAWIDSGITPFNIAVNISVGQLYQSNFCDMVKGILREVRLTPKYLELELTEGVFIGNLHSAIEIMNNLKKNEIFLALDDFGTGYSSLSYLSSLPFSKLKIDKSFITKIHTDNAKQDIVKAIILLARSFGMKIVAEGAETREEVEYLRKIGCAAVQGYYFAKPMSAEALEAFVKQNRRFS